MRSYRNAKTLTFRFLLLAPPARVSILRSAMMVVFSPACLEYEHPGHPESPERVRLITQALGGDSRYTFVEPHKATVEDLFLVHHVELVEEVEQNTFREVDTPNFPNIMDAALLSVGAAVRAAEIAKEEDLAFSLSRPPGHHAGPNYLGGFCYFNNIAVASAKLLRQGKRVAILDIDVHHGNGTQDIFKGYEMVLYCSLHQIPLYPGTGWETEGNCYNFPLPPGTTAERYLLSLGVALEKTAQFQPDILAVSLGLDTYKGDPLAQMKIDIWDYRLIGEKIRGLGVPTFFVLEGGYSKEIGKCVLSFFDGVLGATGEKTESFL